MKPVICTFLKFSLKKGAEKPLQQTSTMGMFFHKYPAHFVNRAMKNITLSAFGEDKKIQKFGDQLQSPSLTSKHNFGAYNFSCKKL